MEQDKYLLGMTLAEIGEQIELLKLPKFAAKQIADWVYVKRVNTIDEMTNISVRNRDILKKSLKSDVQKLFKRKFQKMGRRNFCLKQQKAN